MNYRCGKRSCRKRRSGRFKQPPQCPGCGGEMRNITGTVKRWNEKQVSCDCGLIHYKHREGSPGCQSDQHFDPWAGR